LYVSSEHKLNKGLTLNISSLDGYEP